MSPKCPQCGYQPPRGRPKKIDEARAIKLRKIGRSFRTIAKKLGCTEGAVRAAIKRIV